jgi:hypothetical protein
MFYLSHDVSLLIHHKLININKLVKIMFARYLYLKVTISSFLIIKIICVNTHVLRLAGSIAIYHHAQLKLKILLLLTLSKHQYINKHSKYKYFQRMLKKGKILCLGPVVGTGHIALKIKGPRLFSFIGFILIGKRDNKQI